LQNASRISRHRVRCRWLPLFAPVSLRVMAPHGSSAASGLLQRQARTCCVECRNPRLSNGENTVLERVSSLALHVLWYLCGVLCSGGVGPATKTKIYRGTKTVCTDGPVGVTVTGHCPGYRADVLPGRQWKRGKIARTFYLYCHYIVVI
jgi:hypothetical protein